MRLSFTGPFHRERGFNSFFLIPKIEIRREWGGGKRSGIPRCMDT